MQLCNFFRQKSPCVLKDFGQCSECGALKVTERTLSVKSSPGCFPPWSSSLLAGIFSLLACLSAACWHIFITVFAELTQNVKKNNNNHEWLVFKYGLATGLLYKISCKGAVVAIGWCFLNILQIYSDCTCDAWGLLVGSGGENFFIMLQKNMHFQWG